MNHSSCRSSPCTDHSHFRFFHQGTQEVFNILVYATSPFVRECVLKFEAQGMSTSNYQFTKLQLFYKFLGDKIGKTLFLANTSDVDPFDFSSLRFDFAYYQNEVETLD